MWSVLSSIPRRGSVVWLCLLMASLVSAQEEAIPKQVQEWQQAAANAVEQKDFANAVTIYEQIIQHYPQTRYAIEAHRETAIVAINAKQFEAAKARIESLKTQYADHADIAGCLHWIAIHYGWNEQWEEAVQLHRYNAAAHPSHERAMWSQVEIVYDHIRRKDWAGAQTAVAEMLTRFAQQPTLPKEIWQISRAYANAGRAEAAMEMCVHLANAFPETEHGAIAQSEIVIDQIQRKDYPAAAASVQQLIAAFSTSPSIASHLHGIAIRYARNERWEEAEQLHRHNATAHPSHEQALWSQVEIVYDHIRRKDWEGAQTAVAEMLTRFAKQPTLSKEIWQISRAYANAGRAETAMEMCVHLAKAFPETEHGTIAQSEVVIDHIRREDWEGAQTAVAEMLTRFAKQPTLPREIQRISRAYANAGRAETAMEMCVYLAKAFPEAEYGIITQSEIAIDQIQRKDYPAAAASVQQLIAAFSTSPSIASHLHGIAIHYARNERWEEAVQLHRHNVTAHPSHERAMWSQVEIVYDHIRREDWEGAQTAVAEMLTRFAQQPTLPREIRQIADRYLHAGQHEQALELCRYGLGAFPDGRWRDDYHMTQVRIYLAMGDIDQANASLDSFWTPEGDHKDSIRLLEQVKTLYWRQDHREASQALCERIIAAFPDDPATAAVFSDYICGRVAMGQDAET